MADYDRSSFASRGLALSVAGILTVAVFAGIFAPTSSAATPRPVPSAVGYGPLIADLQTAFETGDTELFRTSVWTPYGEREVWLGNWGGCGSGVRVAPINEENLDVIFGGEPIEVVSVARRDVCGEFGGDEIVYGLVTTGWEGRTLPHTYSGKGGPGQIMDYTFAEDAALLVMWQPSRKESYPAIAGPAVIGIGPADSIETVAGLPVLPGDAQCDGDVDSIDAALVLQLAAGLTKTLACDFQGNVSADGTADALDSLLILQRVAGLFDSFAR